jgi:hypothetical protein
MELVLGPFDGYYAAVRVRRSGAKVQASYKVCVTPPADYRTAPSLRHRRVEGLFESLEEGCDIAEQLARLHIAGLSGSKPENLAAENHAGPAEAQNSLDHYPASDGWGTMYSPTEPAALSPMDKPAQPCSLYAPTEPAPLLFPIRR